ncbi:MAG TPA: extracellular solute-binding protein, partial [Candidatus Ozemobacteraceae bacterium]|nr:extracellular solute-binding protein [Candidatus Ozemobacteraceae bacterium]
MDDAFTKSHLHEEPAVKALKVMQDMLKAGTAYEGQGFDPQNDFKSQRVAMIDQSIVSKVHMETGSGLSFPYGIAPLPGQATNAVILSGSNINIFNNGNPDKIKGAWDFVKWFTSTEVGAEWARDTTYLPVRKSSIQHQILQDKLVQDPNLRAPFESLAYAQFEPRIFCWFEIRDMMADHLERATLRPRSKLRDLADWAGLARLGLERFLPAPVADLPEPGPHLLNLSKDIDGILRHSAK